MNHLYFHSTQLLKILQKHKELLKLIDALDSFDESYNINPQNIINVGNDPNAQSQGMKILKTRIRTMNEKVLTVIRSVRPNKIYKQIDDLIIDLNLFDKSYNDENQLIKHLKDFPELHTDAYSEKNAKYIFDIIKASNKINQSIKEASDRAKFIIDSRLNSKLSTPINYYTIRIGTDQELILIDDFIDVFKHIESIYKFICYLHKLDSENQPLIINQVSTGSWYTELLGAKQAIISLENLLKGIGQLIRDYITGKIKLERFENKCKETEAFIKLCKVAEENGIRNPQVGIFKELNPFVESFKTETTIIEINDEEILKIRKTEKLTLSQRPSKRKQLLEKIRLNIEKGKDDEVGL